jgi:membrane-associated protein
VVAQHLLAVNVLDPHSLLSSFGVVGIFVVLLAETGLLIGIFLPGDSLLFTAGLLCTTSATNTLHLSLPAVLIAAVAGALVGAQLGFLLGRRAGPSLTSPKRGPRLRAAIDRGRVGLQRYGPPKAIVLRTVMNPLAGALGIDARTFTIWQVIGGIGWSAGVTLAGYALGSRIPSIDKYLLPIIAVIVIISLIPVALEVRRARSERNDG